jgi:hypothetical protein
MGDRRRNSLRSKNIGPFRATIRERLQSAFRTIVGIACLVSVALSIVAWGIVLDLKLLGSDPNLPFIALLLSFIAIGTGIYLFRGSNGKWP